MLDKIKPRWLRRTLIVITAPIEIIGLALIGAWVYGKDGVSNVVNGWRDS